MNLARTVIGILAFIFLLSGIVLLLVGCNSLEHGIIMEKSYHPDYYWMMPMTNTISTGNSSYTYTYFIPMYSPPAWSILIVGHSPKNGKKKVERWYVNREEWSSLEVGCEFDTKTYHCSKNRTSERRNEYR